MGNVESGYNTQNSIERKVGCDCCKKSKYFERERTQNCQCDTQRRSKSFARIVDANCNYLSRLNSISCTDQPIYSTPLLTPSLYSEFDCARRIFDPDYFQHSIQVPTSQSTTGFNLGPNSNYNYKPIKTVKYNFNPTTNTLRGYEPFNPFNPNNNTTPVPASENRNRDPGQSQYFESGPDNPYKNDLNSHKSGQYGGGGQNIQNETPNQFVRRDQTFKDGERHENWDWGRNDPNFISQTEKAQNNWNGTSNGFGFDNPIYTSGQDGGGGQKKQNERDSPGPSQINRDDPNFKSGQNKNKNNQKGMPPTSIHDDPSVTSGQIPYSQESEQRKQNENGIPGQFNRDDPNFKSGQNKGQNNPPKSVTSGQTPYYVEGQRKQNVNDSPARVEPNSKGQDRGGQNKENNATPPRQNDSTLTSKSVKNVNKNENENNPNSPKTGNTPPKKIVNSNTKPQGSNQMGHAGVPFVQSPEENVGSSDPSTNQPFQNQNEPTEPKTGQPIGAKGHRTGPGNVKTNLNENKSPSPIRNQPKSKQDSSTQKRAAVSTAVGPEPSQMKIIPPQGGQNQREENLNNQQNGQIDQELEPYLDNFMTGPREQVKPRGQSQRRENSNNHKNSQNQIRPSNGQPDKPEDYNLVPPKEVKSLPGQNPKPRVNGGSQLKPNVPNEDNNRINQGNIDDNQLTQSNYPGTINQQVLFYNSTQTGQTSSDGAHVDAHTGTSGSSQNNLDPSIPGQRKGPPQNNQPRTTSSRQNPINSQQPSDDRQTPGSNLTNQIGDPSQIRNGPKKFDNSVAIGHENFNTEQPNGTPTGTFLEGSSPAQNFDDPQQNFQVSSSNSSQQNSPQGPALSHNVPKQAKPSRPPVTRTTGEGQRRTQMTQTGIPQGQVENLIKNFENEPKTNQNGPRPLSSYPQSGTGGGQVNGSPRQNRTKHDQTSKPGPDKNVVKNNLNKPEVNKLDDPGQIKNSDNKVTSDNFENGSGSSRNNSTSSGGQADPNYVGQRGSNVDPLKNQVNDNPRNSGGKSQPKRLPNKSHGQRDDDPRKNPTTGQPSDPDSAPGRSQSGQISDERLPNGEVIKPFKGKGSNPGKIQSKDDPAKKFGGRGQPETMKNENGSDEPRTNFIEGGQQTPVPSPLGNKKSRISKNRGQSKIRPGQNQSNDDPGTAVGQPETMPVANQFDNDNVRNIKGTGQPNRSPAEYQSKDDDPTKGSYRRGQSEIPLSVDNQSNDDPRHRQPEQIIADNGKVKNIKGLGQPNNIQPNDPTRTTGGQDGHVDIDVERNSTPGQNDGQLQDQENQKPIADQLDNKPRNSKRKGPGQLPVDNQSNDGPLRDSPEPRKMDNDQHQNLNGRDQQKRISTETQSNDDPRRTSGSGRQNKPETMTVDHDSRRTPIEGGQQRSTLPGTEIKDGKPKNSRGQPIKPHVHDVEDPTQNFNGEDQSKRMFTGGHVDTPPNSKGQPEMTQVDDDSERGQNKKRRVPENPFDFERDQDIEERGQTSTTPSIATQINGAPTKNFNGAGQPRIDSQIGTPAPIEPNRDPIKDKTKGQPKGAQTEYIDDDSPLNNSSVRGQPKLSSETQVNDEPFNFKRKGHPEKTSSFDDGSQTNSPEYQPQGTQVNDPSRSLNGGQPQGTQVNDPSRNLHAGQPQGTQVSDPSRNLHSSQPQGTQVNDPSRNLHGGQPQRTQVNDPSRNLHRGQPQGTQVNDPSRNLHRGQPQGNDPPNNFIGGQNVPKDFVETPSFVSRAVGGGNDFNSQDEDDHQRTIFSRKSSVNQGQQVGPQIQRTENEIEGDKIRPINPFESESLKYPPKNLVTQSVRPEAQKNVTQGTGSEKPPNMTQAVGPEKQRNVTQGTGLEPRRNVTQLVGPETQGNLNQSVGPETQRNVTQGTGPDIQRNVTRGTGLESPRDVTQGTGSEKPPNMTQAVGPEKQRNVTQGTDPELHRSDSKKSKKSKNISTSTKKHKLGPSTPQICQGSHTGKPKMTPNSSGIQQKDSRSNKSCTTKKTKVLKPKGQIPCQSVTGDQLFLSPSNKENEFVQTDNFLESPCNGHSRSKSNKKRTNGGHHILDKLKSKGHHSVDLCTDSNQGTIKSQNGPPKVFGPVGSKRAHHGLQKLNQKNILEFNKSESSCPNLDHPTCPESFSPKSDSNLMKRPGDSKRKTKVSKEDPKSMHSMCHKIENDEVLKNLNCRRRPENRVKSSHYPSSFTCIYPTTGNCPPGTIRTRDGFFVIPKSKQRDDQRTFIHAPAIVRSAHNTRRIVDSFNDDPQLSDSPYYLEYLRFVNESLTRKSGCTRKSRRWWASSTSSSSACFSNTCDLQSVAEVKRHLMRVNLDERHFPGSCSSQCLSESKMKKRNKKVSSSSTLMSTNGTILPTRAGSGAGSGVQIKSPIYSMGRLESDFDEYLNRYETLLGEIRELELRKIESSQSYRTCSNRKFSIENNNYYPNYSCSPSSFNQNCPCQPVCCPCPCPATSLPSICSSIVGQCPCSPCPCSPGQIYCQPQQVFSICSMESLNSNSSLSPNTCSILTDVTNKDPDKLSNSIENFDLDSTQMKTMQALGISLPDLYPITESTSSRDELQDDDMDIPHSELDHLIDATVENLLKSIRDEEYMTNSQNICENSVQENSSNDSILKSDEIVQEVTRINDSIQLNENNISNDISVVNSCTDLKLSINDKKSRDSPKTVGLISALKKCSKDECSSCGGMSPKKSRSVRFSEPVIQQEWIKQDEEESLLDMAKRIIESHSTEMTKYILNKDQPGKLNTQNNPKSSLCLQGHENKNSYYAAMFGRTRVNNNNQINNNNSNPSLNHHSSDTNMNSLNNQNEILQSSSPFNLISNVSLDSLEKDKNSKSSSSNGILHEFV